jgi:hypothetical protein
MSGGGNAPDAEQVVVVYTEIQFEVGRQGRSVPKKARELVAKRSGND